MRQRALVICSCLPPEPGDGAKAAMEDGGPSESPRRHVHKGLLRFWDVLQDFNLEPKPPYPSFSIRVIDIVTPEANSVDMSQKAQFKGPWAQ